MAILTKRQTEVVATVTAAGAVGFDNYNAETKAYRVAPAVLHRLIDAGVVEIFQDTRAPGRVTRYRVKQ